MGIFKTKEHKNLHHIYAYSCFYGLVLDNVLFSEGEG